MSANMKQSLRLKRLFRKLWLRASYCYCPPSRLSLEHVSLRLPSLGKVDLVLPRNEDVGRLIYYLREYESEYADYILRVLRPGDICFDVGANLGYYTILMAKSVPQGKVYAFEPDPFSYALLQLNVQLNGLKNVIVNQSALGDRPGMSTFVQCTDSAFNSFRDTARRAVSGIIEVSVDTLDNFVYANNIPRIDFLKLDVEGAEGLVIAGAKKLFQDPILRPRLLLIELFEENHRTFGDSAAGIIEFLGRNQYAPLSTSGEKLTAPIPSDLINVFFAPDLPSGVKSLRDSKSETVPELPVARMPIKEATTEQSC